MTEITHDYLVGEIQTTTTSVLSMMMGIESECDAGVRETVEAAGGLPQQTSPGQETEGETVEAFVGISGPLVGTGTVSCDVKTACRLASAMMMTEFPSVSGEVLDAMGEVANMIVGNLKTALEERVGTLWLSVPSVVYGRNFTARTVGTFEWTIVQVKLPEGQLRVRICLTEAKPAPNKVQAEPVAAMA